MNWKNNIVLVPFPFDDLSTTKVRPALCLTDRLGNYEHVIVAFITSQLPTTLNTTDVIIRPMDRDFSQTGLRVASTICLHRLMSLSTTIIRRKLGALPEALQQQIQNGHARFFDCDA